MSEFFDILETRPPEQREAELFTLLSAQVAHAQESAPAVADMLAGVDATTLVRRSVLEKLPLLQKSELIERQKQTPIFGGLTALAPPELGQ
ncbi:MAG: phenylacetate--CoA ligase family protein, partial [Desulfuromonadales bacterium]|nr:phenylacetate--CoA ligase family protein [Desulfuromonadales bacterium]